MKYLKYFTKYIIISFIFFISCSKSEENFVEANDLNIGSDKVFPEKVIDLSIENILIYPNQLDENSIYIDIEISNKNEGQGEVQIALLNDGKLVASNPVIISNDKSTYYQSFLVSENINFEKNFKIEISALQGEDNIKNNRHTFESNLKIEKPKIAILSGKLNLNTPYIINNVNADYDHFYPNPLNKNLDITNFWFTKYDIILLDNFPVKPVSDKWLNLFLKKIISEESSLVMNSRLDQDVNVLKNFFPIFGFEYKDDIDLNDFNKYSRYKSKSFKSSFISTNNLFDTSKNEISELNNVIDWILKDSDIKYSFYVANLNSKKNDSIFIYGFSNIVDSEIKSIEAEVLKNGQLISTITFLFNPVSGYYFSQFEAIDVGDYVLNIKDNNTLIDTINVNIYN